MKQVGNSFILFPSSAEIILANMVFDWDADLGLTLEDTDRLQAWTDQSANAVGDIEASSGSNIRPTIITNGNPNGDGNSVRFDGVNNRLGKKAFTFAQPETIYLVVKQPTWQVNDAFIDSFTGIEDMAIIQSSSSPNIALHGGTVVALNSGLAVGDWGIICCVFNGASSSLRVNNNTKTTGNPGSTDADGITIGAKQNGTGDCNVEIARIIGYDTTAHTDAQQDQNITALNNIYSVF